MNENELIRIVNQAIPLRTCPKDRPNDIARRAWLLSKIKQLIDKEVTEKRFHA